MTSRRRIKTRRIERHADHCVGWESIRSGGEEVEGEGAVEVVLDIGGYQCMLPRESQSYCTKAKTRLRTMAGNLLYC